MTTTSYEMRQKISGIIESCQNPRKVIQMHDSGCAIAAIATVVGCSYTKVLKRAFPRRLPRLKENSKYADLRLTPGQMAALIRSYGIPAKVTWPKTPNGTAILLFDWSNDPTDGTHAVVWGLSKDSTKKVIDPDIQWFSDDFYLNRWMESGRYTIAVGV